VAAPVTFRRSAERRRQPRGGRRVGRYVQDQVAIGSRWQAIGGVRVDRFALRLDNRRNGQTLRRTDRLVSPRAGLVFKPATPVSVYSSYSVSYLPSSGDQFASLTATRRRSSRSSSPTARRA
jgi:catecholate siderophore receptor